MEKGGKTNRSRDMKFLNKSESWERAYSKNKPSRKGYKKSLEQGGQTESPKYELINFNKIAVLDESGKRVDTIELAEKIFDEELFDYTITYREDRIDDLVRWISESDRPDMRELMSDDLVELRGWSDEYVFDNISTNEFIGQESSDFNEKVEELIELNKTL